MSERVKRRKAGKRAFPAPRPPQLKLLRTPDDGATDTELTTEAPPPEVKAMLQGMRCQRLAIDDSHEPEAA